MARISSTILGLVCLWLGSANAALAAEGGVDPTRLALPKGPGSIEGLGRTFEPSPASGTASYGLEIATPVSVGGFAPKISLEYDGGGGVSELGLGFRLSGVPAIRRRLDDGLPRFDASDRFELAGIEGGGELVEVEPGVFRSRFESGSFVRVTRSGERWEARSKAGITYRFGGPGFTEAEGTNVVGYLVSEALDRHGHPIRYEWDTSEGRALLVRAVWNDFGESSRCELSFEYEARPDRQELFSSGIRQALSRRVNRIEVKYGGKPYRSYELVYHPSKHSLLTSVRAVGADGVTALPAVSFGYSELMLDGTRVAMASAPGQSPGDPDAALADLDGDSLPDLLLGRAGAYRSYMNQDGRSFAPGRDWPAGASPSVSLGTSGVQLADVDADGAVDLLIKSGTADFRYLPALGASGFGAAISIAGVPSYSFEDPDTRLADVDADRRTDVLVTTAAGLAVSYNLDGRAWTEPVIVGQVDPVQPVRFSLGAEICDVNGDRVEDICLLRSGSLVYWLGRGRGSFEPARTATGVPSFPASDPFKLIDLDGDGWVDLVRVGVTGIDLALATLAGHFDQVKRVEGTPERSPATSVQFADMNGSGTTDIVWVDVSSGAGWQYLELFPRGRAGLLTSIDNGLGKRTRIEYATAAEHAARARGAGKPWTTRLNGGMAVVQRISVGVGLGDPEQVVELSYRNGTWDPTERTFAGFAAATQRDLGDDQAPTKATEYTFDVGLANRALRGKPLTIEERDELSGKLLKRTLNGYLTLEAARSSEYVYRSSERIDHVEGLAQADVRTVLTEWQHDAHGNAIAELRWGEVRGDDKLAGGDEALTRRSFAENEEDWLLGYLASEELTDGAGQRVRLERRYYDGEPLVGLPLGQVTRGDLTRTESWIEDDRFADQERIERDSHGNIVARIDARGGRAEYDYDLESRTFVVEERRFPTSERSVGWKAEYDRVLGVVLEASGPNGEHYSFRYDGLGRLTTLVLPGDTLERPTRHYDYELASPLSILRSVEREVAGSEDGIEKLEFYDGFSRLRGRLEEGSVAGQWVARDVAYFDARGNAAFTAHPSFESAPELPPRDGRSGIATRYDAIGRKLGIVHPDGAATQIRYLPLAREESDENDLDPASPHHHTPKRLIEDGLGRLRRIVENDAGREITSAIYEYDAASKLTQTTDAGGRVRSIRRDGRGRQRSIVDPNAGSWELTYTDGDDLETRSDPGGNRLRFSYDGLGRLLEEWHRKGASGAERRVSARHYDVAAPEHAQATNLAGMLSWVSDDAGTLYFGYSPRGLETERVRRWPDGIEHRMFAEYDSADRRVTRGYPDGSFLEQRYDARGLVSAIGPVVTAIEWTPWGRPASIHLGNGVVDVRHHDERMRLTRLEAKNAAGTPLRDLRYDLDASSRIASVADLRPGVAAAESASGSFQYDDRYRLREARDAIGRTRWEVDDVGNVLSITSDHPSADLNLQNSFGEDGNGPDRLTHHGAEAIEYDAAGRVVWDGERILEWDAKGRLARVVRGPIVEEYTYAYDDVRAIKRTSQNGATSETRYIAEDAENRDGKLVRYVFFDGQRLARLDDLAPGAAAVARPPDAHPDASRWFLIGLVLCAASILVLRSSGAGVRARLLRPALALLFTSACGDSGSPRASSPPRGLIETLPASVAFYLGDLQQSVLAVVDAAGSVVAKNAFHSYGALKQASGGPDPFGFIAREHDAGSGLWDLKARPYRAELGRFLAPDPVALFQADTLLLKPSFFAPYAYAAADPINLADPSGLAPEFVERWVGENVARPIGEGVNTGIRAGCEGLVKGIEFVFTPLILLQRFANKEQPSSAPAYDDDGYPVAPAPSKRETDPIKLAPVSKDPAPTSLEKSEPASQPAAEPASQPVEPETFEQMQQRMGEMLKMEMPEAGGSPRI